VTKDTGTSSRFFFTIVIVEKVSALVPGLDPREVSDVLHRHRRSKVDDQYRSLAIQVQSAEDARAVAYEALDAARRNRRPLSEVRAAYNKIAAVSQEPLPAARALDPQRPPQLSRELSRLRTLRQWNLLDDPPGVLMPASVQPTSRAALGPHVAGLDSQVDEEPDSPYVRKCGVNLKQLLDRTSTIEGTK
jgi:hypothetical protein